MTEQEFEATPIRLPQAAQEELVVGETAAEPSTITREPGAGGIEGKVTITSHGAVNQRGPARGQPTLIEKYLGRVNGTEGAGAAAVATASEVGVDEVTFPGVANEYTLPGDQVSIVAPAGLRGETSIEGINVWLMTNKVPENGNLYQDAAFAVDAAEVFPGLVYNHGQEYDPMQEWMPAGYPAPRPDFLSEGKVLIALDPALNPEDVFGIPAEEMPGERLEEGDSLQPFNPFLIVAPRGPITGDQSPVSARYKYFNTGTPTWVGGATYGMSVLSTPAGEVAGQSVNPVSGMSLEELLTSDQARELLKQAGVTDADEVEWLTGPNPAAGYNGVHFASDPPDANTILNQEAELRSFLGVVSGEDGPWGVGVHMSRVENERDNGTDIVVAAAVHRAPLPAGPARIEDYWSRLGTDERFTGIVGSIITEARGLTAAANQRLRPITY